MERVHNVFYSVGFYFVYLLQVSHLSGFFVLSIFPQLPFLMYLLVFQQLQFPWERNTHFIQLMFMVSTRISFY